METEIGGRKFAPASSSAQQRMIIKRDHLFISEYASDEAVKQQILATHAPDHGHEIDIKLIHQIVEGILSRATPPLMLWGLCVHGVHKQQSREYLLEDDVLATLHEQAYIIQRISGEISCKCFPGVDGHQTAMSLFNMLSSYSWDAKLVLTLAAFASNYGEFWLLAQIYTSNQFAKLLAVLKQLPTILAHSGPLKPMFEALDNLVKAMLDLSRSVVEINNQPSTYITEDVPAFRIAMAANPTAVYWNMRAVVACATQITSITGMNPDLYITSATEALELSSLAYKINTINEHLNKQLGICYQVIDDKRNDEAYTSLLHIFEMNHSDNMKVLKALICAKDDFQPLYNGISNRLVNLEVLRRNNVLLLISSLTMSQDELAILEQIYNFSRQPATRSDGALYEIVWMPIIDHWGVSMQNKFELLKATMPWYTVQHPTMIERPVIKFIRDRWHFRNQPIIVVLDPQGKVISPNAIHMMWIWGSYAFPFTILREEALWKEETWSLELLVDGIDPIITFDWIKKGKYILLYGGDNIEWIRRFTTAALSVAEAAGIPLEMVYAGKSNEKEKVRRIINTITAEMLSHTWQEIMVWFFWTRLESMFFSKVQLGIKADDDVDLTMKEIKKLLSYDQCGGWATLSRGSEVVVNGHSSTMLLTLLEYEAWRKFVPTKGFDRSFKDHHDELLLRHSDQKPCCRIEFQMNNGGMVPESLKCPECHRLMENYISFLCCHRGNAINTLF